MNRQFRHNNLASSKEFSLFFFSKILFFLFLWFSFLQHDPPSTFRYSLAFRPISFYRLLISEFWNSSSHSIVLSPSVRERRRTTKGISRCQLENYRRAERMKFKPKNTIDACVCVCVYIDEYSPVEGGRIWSTTTTTTSTDKITRTKTKHITHRN